MQKYRLSLAVIGLSALLTSCGSQAECTSSDVQQTYLDMVGTLNDEDAAEILESLVFQSVVTKEKDQDTGYRYCAAKIVMKNVSETYERDISYQIEQIESDDATFKVYADQNDLSTIGWTAKALAEKDRINKRTEEITEEAKSNPYVLASEQDARDAGIAIGRRFFGERLDETSVRVIPLDIDGDGVMEFVTGLKINYTSGDSSWYAFASYQYPKEAGEKNTVAFVGEGAIKAIGIEPVAYEMQGKDLYVSMADGSKTSLVYRPSTEAYQAYIRANASGS